MKRWLAFALLAWAPTALAQWAELSFVDPSLRWRTLETANFAVHFPERHRAQARAVAGTAERILPGIISLLRWRPASRIQLVVLDSADFANGLASPVPFNYTMVFLSPPDEGELMQSREWLELVLTHELFHIVHLDMARGAALGLRRVFGRVPFLFPNLLQPRWIMEGLAVQAESDPGKGYGRLGHTHFEGMMRAEASRGFRSLSEINAGGRGFPLNRDYLYGGYFFAFLQERYGQKGLAGFIENYSDNVIPFRVHSNPVVPTGKNMDQLWAEYHDWLTARFASKGASAREGEVVAREWSITNPALAADGTRWYIRGNGYTLPTLFRQARGGKPQAMRDVEQDARLSVSAGGSLLLAQPEICRNYNYYYDLNRIAADGSVKRLTECGRYRLAAPLDDGRTVAVRMESGLAQVVMLDGEVLYRAAAGESVTGVAAKGASVVMTSLRDGRWSLIAITGQKAEVLLSDAAIKHSPRLGDGDEVFFIADYGKVFNVWSLRGGRLARWTEAAHGVREMSAPHGGELLLTTIEADGDALRSYRLPDAPLEIGAPVRAETPLVTGAPSAEAPDRPYSPWRSLLPRSWLPVIEIADGAVKLGVATFGQDALGLHQYIVTPQYEFTQREVLGDALYIYDGRHALLVDRRMSVRETVDDEVEVYTIEEGAQWISTWRHLALNRRFYWGLGGALERERLHRASGPTLSEQDERVLGLVAGFDTRRTQWLSEGPSQGLQVRLFAETSHGLHAAYSGDVYRVDSRLHFPIGRTVVSLRWNEAWGEPDAEPFQLGGSDSDPPTLLPILNQREFALRGYSSGEPSLAGHRARLGTLEWRVPLRDIDRHAMVPPVGINRIAMNLFYDIGDAWPRGGEPDYHRGFGIELMSEIRAGYLFGADFRLGLAKGRDEGGKTTAYLRLGRSF
ncbi:MAG TPA: hypothetical protein VGX52_04620 [Burkholderiales bacterium]|nr:hypothetical protein [Burkholderiales bacterium]